eukprot:scaffold240648_cov23-Tisochrysis_lutea.AAC.1
MFGVARTITFAATFSTTSSSSSLGAPRGKLMGAGYKLSVTLHVESGWHCLYGPWNLPDAWWWFQGAGYTLSITLHVESVWHYLCGPWNLPEAC